MRAKKTFKRWTAEEIVKLTELYADTRNIDLAELLQHSYCGVYQKAQELGLRKSLEFLQKNMCEASKEHLFKKGHKPANAFKKGHEYNKQPEGTESIRRYNNIFVKSHRNKWEHKHKLIWEKVNGEVPQGMCVIFADNDNRNFEIDNLICVDKAELMRRNSSVKYPHELRSIIAQFAWYNRKLKALEK